MPREPDEFTLDVTPVEPYIRKLNARMQWWHAITSHVIALVLIVALCISIIAHLVFICRYPDRQDAIGVAFEKWYSVVSPFAGIALGAYYGTTRSAKK
jgi:biotin carboxylase